MTLVQFQTSVGVELVLENLFIGADGVRDKIPGVVDDQESKLFFPDVVPVQIDESGMDGGGHRRQG
jgi:hypothetical protein